MSAQWYYRVFGEEFGPLSLSDLREAASNGTLSGDDEVRPESLSMWVPTNAVRELQDLFEPQVSIESESKVTEGTSAAVMDEWYYRSIDDQGTEVGPFPFDGIIELAKSGRLSADDEVRLGVDSKWRRAGSMGRLVAVLPFQTRRRSNAPALLPVASTDPLKEMISALPESDSEETLPDVVAEEPVLERKTPRPKSASRSEPTDDLSCEPKTPQTKSKSRRVDKKHIKPTAADASLPAGLDQDIEDQILEELMSPSPVATTPSESTPLPIVPSSISVNLASTASESWNSPNAASNSSSFSRPTPLPPSRSTIKPFKPARSGPSLAERLKNPNTLKGIAALILVALAYGWFSTGAGTGADVARYRELDALFAELKELREKDKEGKRFIPFKEKFLQTAKRIQGEVEKTASADFPARQRILWATKTNMPEMSGSLVTETPAEKQALSNLLQAAYALGLKDAPKIELVANREPD